MRTALTAVDIRGTLNNSPLNYFQDFPFKKKLLFMPQKSLKQIFIFWSTKAFPSLSTENENEIFTESENSRENLSLCRIILLITQKVFFLAYKLWFYAEEEASLALPLGKRIWLVNQKNLLFTLICIIDTNNSLKSFVLEWDVRAEIWYVIRGIGNRYS